MNKEQFTVLSQIYNTLLLVETKGENTLIIAECLKALQGVLNEASQQIATVDQANEETEGE